jgi:hypothetical protein
MARDTVPCCSRLSPGPGVFRYSTEHAREAGSGVIVLPRQDYHSTFRARIISCLMASLRLSFLVSDAVKAELNRGARSAVRQLWCEGKFELSGR